MPHKCTTCGRTFPDGSKEMLSGCPDCGGNKFQFTPKTGRTSPEAGADGEAGSGSEQPAESEASKTLATDAARQASPGGPEPDDEWPETARPSTGGDAADAGGDTPGQTPWPETARRPDERDDRAAPKESEDGDGSGDPIDPDLEGGEEDTAQASARSEVVSRDELPPSTETGGFSPAPEQLADDPETGTSAPSQEPGTRDGRVVSEPDEDDRPSLEQLREELNDQFESIKIVRPGEYELNLMELYDREEYIVSLQEDGRYVIDVPDSWRDGDAPE